MAALTSSWIMTLDCLRTLNDAKMATNFHMHPEKGILLLPTCSIASTTSALPDPSTDLDIVLKTLNECYLNTSDSSAIDQAVKNTCVS